MSNNGLYKENEKENENRNSQVLIEDATMASFGFNNNSEVKVNNEDKRN